MPNHAARVHPTADTQPACALREQSGTFMRCTMRHMQLRHVTASAPLQMHTASETC